MFARTHRRPWSARLAVGVALVSAAAAGTVAGCKKAAPPPPPAAIAITITAEDAVMVRQTVLETGPRISGTLEARERAVVRAEVGGSVVAIGPELGDPVVKGALLVRIEVKTLGDTVRSAEAGVGSAQAAAAVAQREVERTEPLVKGGALAARELDRARANAAAAAAAVTQAKGGVAAARSQLGDATVRAPITAVVAARQVNVGDIVSPGAPLYDLVVPATMRLTATVSSDDLSAVAVGKPVTFSVRGYPGQSFDGSITRLAPAADPVTRQVPILVDLPNPGGKLIAGLYADGRIAAEQRAAVVVPLAAVDTSSDRPTVMRVQGDVAERVPVTLGLRDDRQELVEITSGVAVGEVVLLTRAARGITPGAKVALPGAAPRAPAAPSPPSAPPTAPAAPPPTPAAKPTTPEHG
ncbi:MAG: efflux RND transporter periplasmic adaptor subunit [Myxococcales bacterium]|nr:efflux RND transporter periplasmic adaptor subunit [Myxococcales bacterium]